MSSEVNSSGGFWHLFNPTSSEFKQAEKIFHDELPWERQALVVMASMVGALLFIVGAFPVFCWTVKKLNPRDSSEADKIKAYAEKKGLGGRASSTVDQGKRETERQGVAVKGNTVKKAAVGGITGTGAKAGATPRAGTKAGAAAPNKTGAPAKVTPPKKPLTARDIALGKVHWERYFGEIGEEPPLPPNIDEILARPCPIFNNPGLEGKYIPGSNNFFKGIFNTGKTIGETHMLVLIPETIGGVELNIQGFLDKLKTTTGHKFDHLPESWDIGRFMDMPVGKSRWVLMTKHTIPASFRDYPEEFLVEVEAPGRKDPAKTRKIRKFDPELFDAAQHKEIEKLANQSGLSYELPRVVEAVICMAMHYAHFGEVLFEGVTTRCQETIAYGEGNGFVNVGEDVQVLSEFDIVKRLCASSDGVGARGTSKMAAMYVLPQPEKDPAPDAT